MSVNTGGVLYEENVKDAIKLYLSETPFTKLRLIEENSAGFNRFSTDLSIIYDGTKIDFEIKRFNAQMGEGSVGYYDGVFYPISKTLDDTFNLVCSSLNDRVQHFDALLDFLRLQEPSNYHDSVLALPAQVTKNAWEKAVAKELIKPLTCKQVFDQSIIAKHYNAKGIYYIQIEKKGLYYLNQNPVNLPVPPLSASVNIELRVKRGGSEMVKSIGEPAAGIRLICTSRLFLSTCQKSPYTLDDKNSIKELIDNI